MLWAEEDGCFLDGGFGDSVTLPSIMAGFGKANVV